MRAAAQGRWTVVTRPTRRSSPPAPPRRPRGGGRGCGDEARGGRVRPGVRGPVADGVRGCDRRRAVPAGGGGPRPGRHQQASARRRSRIQCRIMAPLYCDTCMGGICRCTQHHECPPQVVGAEGIVVVVAVVLPCQAPPRRALLREAHGHLGGGPGHDPSNGGRVRMPPWHGRRGLPR